MKMKEKVINNIVVKENNKRDSQALTYILEDGWINGMRHLVSDATRHASLGFFVLSANISV